MGRVLLPYREPASAQGFNGYVYCIAGTYSGCGAYDAVTTHCRGFWVAEVIGRFVCAYYEEVVAESRYVRSVSGQNLERAGVQHVAVGVHALADDRTRHEAVVYGTVFPYHQVDRAVPRSSRPPKGLRAACDQERLGVNRAAIRV